MQDNAIKCMFGRFGETVAVYINETTVKCFTPSVPDDPNDIYREEVEFMISMNGRDYDLNQKAITLTFVGTGSKYGILLVIGCVILFGFVMALFICWV